MLVEAQSDFSATGYADRVGSPGNWSFGVSI
jgi:hypothetical protein